MRELDIVFGLIGLLGYEALRLYKSFIGRRALIPRGQVTIYSVILSALAIFAGACAYALANGNLANALFVGFSVPTGIRALLSPASERNAERQPRNRRKSRQRSDQDVEVDDIQMETSNSAQPARAWAVVREYFD
jgi:hypothetical protein